jgi:hypothetical protein
MQHCCYELLRVATSCYQSHVEVGSQILSSGSCVWERPPGAKSVGPLGEADSELKWLQKASTKFTIDINLPINLPSITIHLHNLVYLDYLDLHIQYRGALVRWDLRNMLWFAWSSCACFLCIAAFCFCFFGVAQLGSSQCQIILASKSCLFHSSGEVSVVSPNRKFTFF